MLKTEVCIIGAGASSLMCACNIENKKVILIEKDEKIGKKILVTGNGRCNLTNLNIEEKFYNSNQVKKYFKKFSSLDTINFFSSIGLETFADNENRVYPISNTANSVLDVLRLKLESKNIQSICGNYVTSLKNLGTHFLIELSNNEKIISEKVVLGLGGNCDLSFVDNISLPKISYTKSLGALKTDINKGLNNIRIPNTKVTLKNDTINFCQLGEVLFKNDSISGIVIFNLSSHLARQKNFISTITLDFLPNFSHEKLLDMLKKRKTLLHEYLCENFLIGIFHKALNNNLIEKCNIDFNKKISNITMQEIEKLAYLIKNYNINTYDILSNNQVYTGGISLKALDENFMFKSTPNLYAIGEMLDVDGECGGYNLQWAWTSGYICGKNL